MNNRRTLTRRHYLTAGGVAVFTGIAGCTSEGEDNAENANNGDETTDTDASSSGSAEASAEASFEIVGLDAPEQVEIGDPHRFSVDVKNTGEADGTWTDTLLFKSGNEDWQEVGEVEMDIPAGETATWQSGEVAWDYQTMVTLGFQEAQQQFQIQVVAAALAYGESFTNPRDMEVSCHDVQLKDAYEYKDYNGQTTYEQAAEGKQWAFVYLRAENVGGSTEFTPLEREVSVVAGNTQYDSEYIMKEEGKYDGGEINPGIVREGWLCYEIPDNLSVDDLVVVYSEGNYEGDWTVRWSS